MKKTGIRKKILAFTLAEAVLTMTILGILAATMVSSLKPAQYRRKGLVTKAGKIYAELDQAMNMIISECTQGGSLATTYANCTRTSGTTARTSLTSAQMKQLFDRYMRFTSDTYSKTDYTCGVTKNKAAICFHNTYIWIDVNGTEGPNIADTNNDATKEDQWKFTLDNNGIVTAMPTVEAAGSN